MNDYHTKKREIQCKIRNSMTTDIEGLKQELLEKGRQRGLMDAKNDIKIN
jgi:hypothetical protein